eukprot:3258598-Lingulodinium_polyedra.AAC.1
MAHWRLQYQLRRREAERPLAKAPQRAAESTPWRARPPRGPHSAGRRRRSSEDQQQAAASSR